MSNPGPEIQWPYTAQLNRIEANLGVAVQLLRKLSTKVDRLMTAVQIEQEDLDTVSAALESLATEVAAIPAGTLPKANEDGLNKSVADLTAAVNTLAAADNPPAPTPTP